METQPLRPQEEIPPYTTSSSNSEPINRPAVSVAAGKSQNDDDSRFVCNVCLDPVKDPVVTLCGHLYCWPCLFRWLNTGHTTCPVCKAGVSKENVIPLFIRGSEQDPRLTCSSTTSEIPNRPNARRPAPIASTFGQNQLGGHPIGAAQIAGLSFSSTGFGFFPSLFGLQFQSFVPPPPSQQIFGRVLTREEDQQVKLSRILVGIGLFLIICLLVF